MDEDCDSSVLVIDLDDEQEENLDTESNNNDDNGRINAINKNSTNYTEDNSVGLNLGGISQVTISSPNRYDDRNSDDDDIQVIDDDDDDDYDDSVRKLVIVANKVGREYLKNKHSNVEDCRNRKSDNQVYKNVIKGGCINRLNPTTFQEDQNQVNTRISRDRVQRCVKIDHPTQRSGCEPKGYQARYVSDDVPYLVDNNSCISSRADVAYIIETPQGYRHANIYRPEAVSIDEYNAAVNGYAHHIHRPKDDLSNDYYRDAARSWSRYIYRPVLSTDDNRRVLHRDTNNHTYEPEQALNMSQRSHGAIYRDINNVPETDLTYEGYNYASMNRVLYHNAHRPELVLSNDYYSHAKMKRDARSNNHQSEENSTNDECRYRYATMNGFPYSHTHEVDALHDYWQIMYRHAYRPEVINVDDYGCAEINGSYSNGYRPPAALSSDPYRSVLPNFYRSAFLDPKLTKHSYPEAAGMYYFPQLSHFNANRPFDDARKRDEAILNLSRKPELSKETTRDESLDGSKLRTILSTSNYMSKYEHSNIHVDKYRKIETYRPIVDSFRSSNTILNSNETTAVQMNGGNQGDPLRTNTSTVIWDTNNVCKTGMSKTQVLTDILPTTNTMHDRYDNNSHLVAKKIHDDILINAKGHVMHNDTEINERKQKNIVIERDIDKFELDRNIRFLVVFFTRVKELVKETFPEFFKSLEIEIETLGKVASNGKVKTDMQFICPLYCSVSTYSLPRFDNIHEDNKIEKHVNRNTICDVCSCIQSCYKLYKKKYFNLLSTRTDERQDNDNKKGRKRRLMAPLAALSRNREQTVISSRQKNPNCKENKYDNNIEINSKINTGSNIESNLYKASLDHNAHEVADDVIKYPPMRLNQRTLLDSLSISNLNEPANNKDKDTTHNNKMAIEKRFQKAASNENEEISVSKSTLDKHSSRDEAEANLSLSLPYDEIANAYNADIISSKLKNKSGRRPEAVFTCHICSCIFIYFASFVSHMRKEHDIIGIEEDIPDECIARKCPFCGIYSKQKYHNEHVKRAHPQIFTHKGEPSEILNVDKNKRFKKRKFIFTCLVCHKNLKSTEVKRHREKDHKGINVAKMFTKKLSTLDY